MLTQHTEKEAYCVAQRSRCYGCFRPQDDCFCDAIPVIRNQTDVFSGFAEHPGRAGQRLAKAIALVRHLNALGKAEPQTENR